MELPRPHSGVTRRVCLTPENAASKPRGFSSALYCTHNNRTDKTRALLVVVFVCTLPDMKTPRKKRPGRPPKGSDKIKGIRLDMRLEAVEKESFKDAADLAGLDLSAWIRERLRAAARKELEGASLSVAFLKR